MKELPADAPKLKSCPGHVAFPAGRSGELVFSEHVGDIDIIYHMGAEIFLGGNSEVHGYTVISSADRGVPEGGAHIAARNENTPLSQSKVPSAPASVTMSCPEYLPPSDVNTGTLR